MRVMMEQSVFNSTLEVTVLVSKREIRDTNDWPTADLKTGADILEALAKVARRLEVEGEDTL